jgi:hypothetical protein
VEVGKEGRKGEDKEGKGGSRKPGHEGTRVAGRTIEGSVCVFFNYEG